MQNYIIPGAFLAAVMLCSLLLIAIVKLTFYGSLFTVLIACVYTSSKPTSMCDNFEEPIFVGSYIQTRENICDGGSDDGSITFYDSEDYLETVGSIDDVYEAEKCTTETYTQNNPILEAVYMTASPRTYRYSRVDLQPDDDKLLYPTMRANIAIKRKVSAGWVVLGFKLSLKTIYEIDEDVDSYDSLSDVDGVPAVRSRHPDTAFDIYGDSDSEDEYDGITHKRYDHGLARPTSVLGFYDSDTDSDVTNTQGSSPPLSGTSTDTVVTPPLRSQLAGGKANLTCPTSEPKKPVFIRNVFSKARSLSSPSLASTASMREKFGAKMRSLSLKRLAS